MDEGDNFQVEEFAVIEDSAPADDGRAAAPDYGDYDRGPISLYEFYALSIGRLIEHAPWELERSVSAYHESFLTEQRCLGLAILLLLGENQVPGDSVQSMPGYEQQARFSVNQAVFRRALKHYFEGKNLNPIRADMVIERMGTYINDSRDAEAAGGDPLEAMFNTVVRRVPPQTEEQGELYAQRVEKIYDYVSGLVDAVLRRYVIVR